MIGFILGTSEGKKILSLMNEFTEDIVVSTATAYGGELLKHYKTRYINTERLNENGFKELINKFNIKVLVDVSHPYAQEVSKIAIRVCKEININYIRYERKSFIKDMDVGDKIIKIKDYSQLKYILNKIEGNILNTTGSNNIETIMDLNLKNRVIHRILPSVTVLQKLVENNVKIDDIVAIKGPFSYDFNVGLIKQYDIKALITKDSGIEGGTREKIDSAIDNDVKVIVIEKPKIEYGQVFDDIDELVNFIKAY